MSETGWGTCSASHATPGEGCCCSHGSQETGPECVTECVLPQPPHTLTHTHTHTHLCSVPCQAWPSVGWGRSADKVLQEEGQTKTSQFVCMLCALLFPVTHSRSGNCALYMCTVGEEVVMCMEMLLCRHQLF